MRFGPKRVFENLWRGGEKNPNEKGVTDMGEEKRGEKERNLCRERKIRIKEGGTKALSRRIGVIEGWAEKHAEKCL